MTDYRTPRVEPAYSDTVMNTSTGRKRDAEQAARYRNMEREAEAHIIKNTAYGAGKQQGESDVLAAVEQQLASLYTPEYVTAPEPSFDENTVDLTPNPVGLAETFIG